MGETHSLLDEAERIWRAGLAGVEPKRLVAESVRIRGRELEFSACKNIFLIASGKAAPGMAEAVMGILGDRVRAGVAVVLPGQNVSLPGIDVLEAPHPLPDERSRKAGRAVLALARAAEEKELVLALLSGGASAQVAVPLPGLPFEDKTRITRELMLRGADITELNIVRKHLSAVKGGRLAEAAFPAEVVSLVISDVIGDDLETIASGPTHWDSSTYADALTVLRKFELWAEAPDSVKTILHDGLAGRLPETLKKDHPAFKRVSSFVIGNNAMALEAAQGEAEALGFQTMIQRSSDRGEARAAAAAYASRLVRISEHRGKSDRPLCLLSGGELTVQVKGRGRGGRNQEFVLAVMEELEKQISALSPRHSAVRRGFEKTGRLAGHDWLVASLGTDGIDGNTDAAGAWAGQDTLARARELGLDILTYLEANDSHRFFERTGGLIVTGQTGTNVMDLRLCLVGSARAPRPFFS